jgi:hypothetical protein
MAKKKRKGRKIVRAPAPVRVAIVLEGGLVTGVIADSHNVRAAVLDLDIREADDEEIVKLECGADMLEGVPVKKDVLTLPVFLDAFFNMIETKEKRT